jgi:hypothetical protein
MLPGDEPNPVEITVHSADVTVDTIIVTSGGDTSILVMDWRRDGHERHGSRHDDHD